jgi:hypothetical protein
MNDPKSKATQNKLYLYKLLINRAMLIITDAMLIKKEVGLKNKLTGWCGVF